MDWELWKAAREGDVVFLEGAVYGKPSEYLLDQVAQLGNILHIAARNGKVEFLKEAMNILPTDIKKQLLVQTIVLSKHTVLHVAAVHSDIIVAKFVIEMYASLSWDDEDHVKPWLALARDGETPLNLALRQLDQADENCVMEIMLSDPKHESCTIADNSGHTPLYYAIQRGYNLVAENILMSPHLANSIVSSTSFLELASLATRCSGNVVRLLLSKCDGWLDNDGNTPLHSALNSKSRQQELALETLSTHPTLCKVRNNKGESPFLLAVMYGYDEIVDEIMRIEEPSFQMLRRNDETTVLHCLSSCSEKTGKMLLGKYWWMINFRDDQGKTALYYAKQANVRWLINLLTGPSRIKKQDFDWIGACEREENLAVFGFVETCKDLRGDCRLKNDTLLHHIKLNSFKDYQNFLKHPSIKELKNMTDHNEATALHRALETKNIHLAKALLLDNEVRQTIADSKGRTAMDLLANLCKEHDEWERMCNEINVNPYLRTSYILPGTNLEQMRTTLSVIAALLATITFAAGFTLPGGINSDNGQALLGKKAAFLVFLLADAYAMCTSMLVLFCLVWSMVSEHGMARLLVDRSVFILMQSLYATLLVFMTGIYVVIEHTSLWAAIVIFVMCSIIGITANKTILHKVIAMLVPAAYREKLDRMRLLEEGNAGAFTTEEDSTDKGE